MPVSLAALNRAHHAAHDERSLRVLEALTALELDLARVRFDAFATALEEHMRREEAHVFPAYDRLPEHPRGASPELFPADHVSLEKGLEACREALDALGSVPAEALRREVVLRLGPFVRLRGVLEHHDLREERFLYPALDAALDESSRRALAEALGPAPPPT